MTKVKKFLLNVAIQICGYFAMCAGGIPIMLGWPYLPRQLSQYSPEITLTRNPITSAITLPLYVKIVLLIICITLLIIMMLRGNKYRRVVFNDIT